MILIMIRLVEALAALLFVAASAVSTRRKRALVALEQKLEGEKWWIKRDSRIVRSEAGRVVKGKIDKKRKLGDQGDHRSSLRKALQWGVGHCHISQWSLHNIDNGNSNGNKGIGIPLGLMADNGDDVKLTSSRTNVLDLREYVSSNLRSYMGEGKCYRV